jgi:hypothetical protein
MCKPPGLPRFGSGGHRVHVTVNCSFTYSELFTTVMHYEVGEKRGRQAPSTDPLSTGTIVQNNVNHSFESAHPKFRVGQAIQEVASQHLPKALSTAASSRKNSASGVDRRSFWIQYVASCELGQA